jgi:hypothetical protein
MIRALCANSPAIPQVRSGQKQTWMIKVGTANAASSGKKSPIGTETNIFGAFASAIDVLVRVNLE